MDILSRRTCLGIDISGDDIKIIELRRCGANYEVLQAARITIRAEDAATALWHFLLDTETRTHGAVCALPSNECSIKFAKLPNSKPVDLARMARFEAETQFPLPLSEMIWDYSVGEALADGMCPIVLAGTRKQRADDAIGVIESARLEPVGLTVASLAGVGAVMASNRQRSGPLLIIDIGADWTDIAVLDDGRLIASRSVELAGKKLTEALARDLNVDLAEAEHLKISRGIGISVVTSDAGANQKSSVEEWIEGMSLEIRRSAVAVMASGLSGPLHTAVLIGGNAQVPMLADTLGSRTGLRVEIGDPWEDMLLSDVASHTQQELSATFAVATGAALMGLDAVDLANLLPRNRVEMRQRKRREAATILGLVAVIVVLLSMFISGQRSLYTQSKQLHLVTSKMNWVEREIRSLPPNTTTAAIAVKETVASVEQERTSPIELLRVLSINLPRSISLTEFSFDAQKSVVLKGDALSNSVVADTIDVLNELEIFESVDLDYSNIAANQDGSSYDFQITCALPEPALKTISKGGTGESKRTGIVVR